jgi:hypothetical protein
MAVSNLILTALATNLFKDTLSGAVAVSIKAAPGTFFVIHADNALNPAAASFIKLYDTAGAVVVGTTVPDWVIKVPAAFVGNVLIATDGIAFAAGLQLATVTTGGTGGLVAPTLACIIAIAYT